jgi:hypothetical protein
MIVHVENLKTSNKILLKPLNNCNNVSEYKANVKKSVAVLHTSIELVEFEIKNTISGRL